MEYTSCFLIIPFDMPLESLQMTLHINDTMVQKASYDLMIYKPIAIVEEIKSFMSFEDGDIIMSGTPKGVNTYKAGDEFIGRIYSDEMIIVETKWSAK